MSEKEYQEAFSAYIREGDTKAITGKESPEGGYPVPRNVEHNIERRLATISPVRSISCVRQTSLATHKLPVLSTGPNEVAETEFPTMELYAMPAATATFLDDAAVDVGQWIAEEVETAFAEQETVAFINGDGVAKPQGILNAPHVLETEWEWGKIGYLGNNDTNDLADTLIDLVYALKAGYRQDANWVMNRRTQAQLRKIKDADGNYLWQPSHQPGARPTLMGFPVVEAEDMPDIGDGETPIAFGDFQRGYLIVDRLGVNVIRDPYSAKPYVLFYTTKRVGGGVLDFDAIKLLKWGSA